MCLVVFAVIGCDRGEEDLEGVVEELGPAAALAIRSFPISFENRSGDNNIRLVIAHWNEQKRFLT